MIFLDGRGQLCREDGDAALAACARKRDDSFRQFLFTVDTMSNVHDYDARDFGTGSHEKTLLFGQRTEMTV